MKSIGALKWSAVARTKWLRQVRATRSLLCLRLLGAGAELHFWEHRCTIGDPRQHRYCFHRVKNISLRHAIIFAADARASPPPRRRDTVSHPGLVFVTGHKYSGYLERIERSRLGINENRDLVVAESNYGFILKSKSFYFIRSLFENKRQCTDNLTCK